VNAKNYNALMEKEVASFDKKQTLLLHCCCAPCSSACLERLKDSFEITVFFCNPNIEDAEYEKRKAELIRFIGETGYAEILECGHDTGLYYSAIKGLEGEKEGGKRCEKCFYLRLKETAETAEKFGFGYFATTLTISPLKNARLINEIGEKLAEGKKVKWLYSDFKKKDGYLNSLRLSEKYNLYRQNYCGCVYSKNK